MMNDPYFDFYSNQQPSRSVRFVPGEQSHQRSSPKVVSVPVHFISSEKPRTTVSMLKDSSAFKIQRVFRGFLVRKSVKKIASIRNEVSEIERRIGDVEVFDLIRRDAKERLRVNETLMSLLFKLDSIPGVDCGVRVLRKAVTRKVIALQEKVDSIAQADHQTLDSPNNNSGKIDLHNVRRSSSEWMAETSDEFSNLEAVDDDGDGGIVKEVVKEIVENYDPAADLSETGKDGGKDDGRNNVNGNRELLEKLMADHENMMKLMMQIFERNEMQTRMINSLSRKVEQLEKRYMADKLRRKKKPHVSLRMRNKDHFCI